MEHFGPDLKRGAHIRRAGDGGEAERIIEQRFRRADLDERGRQAAEIGVDGRDEGRARVRAGEIGGGELLQIRFLDHRIDGGSGLHGGAAHFEIGPGRGEPDGGGKGEARIAERDEGGEREAAARAFARERDAGGGEAGGEEKAIGGEAVLERGGERVLGREAVVEREGAGTGLAAGLRDHVAVACEGAGDVAAAMEEEDDAGRIGRLCCRPFGGGADGGIKGDAGGRDRLDTEIGRKGILGAERIEAGAAFGEAGGAGAGCEAGADRFEFGVGHESGSGRVAGCKEGPPRR